MYDIKPYLDVQDRSYNTYIQSFCTALSNRTLL